MNSQNYKTYLTPFISNEKINYDNNIKIKMISY